MSVKLSPIFVGQQFFSNSGQPLSGGLIYQYQAGTTTLQASFTDSTGTVQNANPITLDSTGRYSQEIWFTAGLTYKLVLKDSNNNTISTYDGLSGVNDTTSGVTSEWLPQSTPTFVNGTTFTVAGNQTTTFQVGMRVKATINSGFIYGTIATSVFTTLTTITITTDSGALDSTLSAVSVGLLGATDGSAPIAINQLVAFTAHRSTNQTSGTTVIFDTVDKQTGGTNYSNTTGIFTAPFTGWYRFSVSGEVDNTSGVSAIEALSLVANGVKVARGGTGSNNLVNINIACACSSEVFLSSGQTASVQNDPGAFSATLFLVGATTSSFSGFLLQRTA